MTKIRNHSLLGLALCLMCIPVNAQDAGLVAELEAESNFSSWPGQSGPVQGFSFQPASYPELAGFTVSSTELMLDYLPYGLIESVRLTRGTRELTFTIGVGAGMASNAHELFLGSVAASTDLDYFDAHVRGDPGIPIGNLNFVPLNATPSNLGGYIAFLRNNVFCVLADNGDDSSFVDFSGLATRLDASILAQSSPSLGSQFNYAPPVIDTFSAATTTLSASAGSSTTVTIAVTDPTAVMDPPGGSGPITRQFLDGGNLDVTDSGGSTVTVSATSTVGTLPLELVVINAYLQFSSQSINFTVGE